MLRVAMEACILGQLHQQRVDAMHGAAALLALGTTQCLLSPTVQSAVVALSCARTSSSPASSSSASASSCCESAPLAGVGAVVVALVDLCSSPAGVCMCRAVPSCACEAVPVNPRTLVLPRTAGAVSVNAVLRLLHTRALCSVLWQLAAVKPEALRELVFHAVDAVTMDVIVTRWDNLEALDTAAAAHHHVPNMLCSACVTAVAAGDPHTQPLCVCGPADLPLFFEAFYAAFEDTDAVVARFSTLRQPLSRTAFAAVCAAME